MVGSKSSRLARAATGATRIALALTTALTAISVSAVKGTAQQGLFETGVEAYRRQLAEFKARAAALMKEIDEVPVGGVYCDPADKRAAGRALAELRSELGDLERDWSAFQRSVEGSVEVSGTGGQMMQRDIDPLAPGFWAKSTQEVIQGPRKAFEAKLERYRNTPVVDCSDPAARRRSPPPPEPPQKDPLAGLKRPSRLLQGIPSIPKPFCTQEELDAWRRAISQMLRENQNAATDLRNYHDAVLDRLLPALRSVPEDAAAVRALEGEVAWIKAEHDRLTRIYGEILKIYAMGQVVDCTEHLTTPQPEPPRDSVKPVGAGQDTTQPHTQERPGTSSPPPVDTTRPRTQEKPGTGTPNGAEPPKTGAIPGGKVGRGEWFFGAGIDENWYQEFAHTAGDQANIDGFSGKRTTPGWGVGLGFAQGGWRFWACRHVNTLHYTQLFAAPGSPFSRVDGDLTGTFYDLSVGHRFRFVWKTHVEVNGGVTYAYDYLGLDPVTSLGVSVEPSHRTLETWKTNLGLAVERPLSPDLNWRLNMTYTGAGTSNDADLNLRVGAGVTYRLPLHFGF
jgi:hypothetical protein